MFYIFKVDTPDVCRLISDKSIFSQLVIHLGKNAQKYGVHIQIRKSSTPLHWKWVRVVGEHGICDYHAGWVFINRPHGEEET